MPYRSRPLRSAREEWDQAARERDLLLSPFAEGLENVKRQAERQYYGQDEGQGVPYGDLERIRTEVLKEADLMQKEWYETGRWAEYFVSGELVRRARAFSETHDFTSIHSEGYLYDFALDPEQSEKTFLKKIETALVRITLITSAISPRWRARLFSGDPKETVIAAQLVLDKAKRIVEEHEGYLQSFRRVPEHYYATQRHSTGY